MARPGTPLVSTSRCAKASSAGKAEVTLSRVSVCASDLTDVVATANDSSINSESLREQDMAPPKRTFAWFALRLMAPHGDGLVRIASWRDGGSASRRWA